MSESKTKSEILKEIFAERGIEVIDIPLVTFDDMTSDEANEIIQNSLPEAIYIDEVK